jgi:hypothetical protein
MDSYHVNCIRIRSGFAAACARALGIHAREFRWEKECAAKRTGSKPCTQQVQDRHTILHCMCSLSIKLCMGRTRKAPSLPRCSAPQRHLGLKTRLDISQHERRVNMICNTNPCSMYQITVSGTHKPTIFSRSFLAPTAVVVDFALQETERTDLKTDTKKSILPRIRGCGGPGGAARIPAGILPGLQDPFPAGFHSLFAKN